MRFARYCLVAGVLTLGACADSSSSTAPESGAPLQLLPVACAAPVPVQGTPNPRAPLIIVLFKDGVDATREAARLAARHGFEVSRLYPAIGGFAALISSAQLAALRCETTIAIVEHDAIVTIAR
ncbi:MAG: hypothetical protein MUF00_02770 [Gemmatimonadaceae bacterium]|nr:hypothetical protein [Gemmatimonadaceae bacterium]